MQRADIDKIKPCNLCSGPIVPIHYKVTIEQVAVDMDSVQEFAGLTQFFHGHSRLADAMGTGIKMQTMGTWRGVVCLACQEKLLDLMGQFQGDEPETEH